MGEKRYNGIHLFILSPCSFLPSFRSLLSLSLSLSLSFFLSFFLSVSHYQHYFAFSLTFSSFCLLSRSLTYPFFLCHSLSLSLLFNNPSKNDRKCDDSTTKALSLASTQIALRETAAKAGEESAHTARLEVREEAARLQSLLLSFQQQVRRGYVYLSNNLSLCLRIASHSFCLVLSLSLFIYLSMSSHLISSNHPSILSINFISSDLIQSSIHLIHQFHLI